MPGCARSKRATSPRATRNARCPGAADNPARSTAGTRRGATVRPTRRFAQPSWIEKGCTRVPMPEPSRKSVRSGWPAAILTAFAVLFMSGHVELALAASRLHEFLPKAQPSELVK